MPQKKPRARTPYSYGPFYDLVVGLFPEHRTVQNVFDVPRLSLELDCTYETIYKMFRLDKLQPSMAARLIAHAEKERKRLKKKGVHVDALTKADLIDYVIPDEVA